MHTKRNDTTGRLAIGLLTGLCLLAAGCQVVENIARNLGASDKEAELIGGGADAAAVKMTPIGWDEEYEYGGSIATMIVTTYGGLYENEALELYVNQVGWTVANYSDRNEIRYVFGILDTDEVQAMAAPGGFVFITRGLLMALEDEAQLAAVLAHEVAHIVNKDSLKIIKNLKARQELSDAAADAWKGAGAFSGVMDGYIDDFLANGLPKKVELAADVDSVTILDRVGYDPLAMREALERIETKIHADHDASFNRTHPSFGDRFAKLDKALLGVRKGGQRNVERFKQQMAALQAQPAE